MNHDFLISDMLGQVQNNADTSLKNILWFKRPQNMT